MEKPSSLLTRWLIALLLIATAFVTRPSIHGNDGVQNYAYLRSLLFDHDLDFTNEYAYYFSRASRWFDEKQIPRDEHTGRPINLYGIGSAILWAPWVICFHAAGSLANHLFGFHLTLDGYSRLYERAVGYGSALYASVGILLLYVLLVRYFASQTGFWAVIIIWLATPLFFYGFLHPSMSHANSFFLSAALMSVYFSRWPGKMKWGILGVIAGLLTLTRFQDGVLLLAIGTGEATQGLCLWRRKSDWKVLVGWLRRQTPRWLLFATLTGMVFSLQCLAWWKIHGSPLSGPKGYLTQGTVDLIFPKHLLSALLSPFHGLFHWHPTLLLGLSGLLLRGIPLRLRVYALTGFLAQAWVIGSWSIWWAGASFGQRMFISALPHLAIGIAACVSAMQRWHRWLVPVFVSLAIWWNFGLVVQYASRMIPRQAPVALTTLARNNIFQVPPHLIKALQGEEKTTDSLSPAPPNESN